MKTLTAKQLADQLEVDNIFVYMIESYDNGQFRQLRKLFDRLQIFDKEQFSMLLEEMERCDILKLLLIHRL